MEATTGFEPVHSGFADRCVNQLRHVANSPGMLAGSALAFKQNANNVPYFHGSQIFGHYFRNLFL